MFIKRFNICDHACANKHFNRFIHPSSYVRLLSACGPTHHLLANTRSLPRGGPSAYTGVSPFSVETLSLLLPRTHSPVAVASGAKMSVFTDSLMSICGVRMTNCSFLGVLLKWANNVLFYLLANSSLTAKILFNKVVFFLNLKFICFKQCFLKQN